MAGTVEARLAELGIELPEAAAPVANYVPAAEAGGLVFVSGQLPFWNGELKGVGKVGRDMDAEAAAGVARYCALNLIAHARAACGGDLDRVARVVRLGVFVNCTDDFASHPQVANGASNLVVDVFGEAGRHARTAVGVPSLPLGAAVEVEAVFQTR